MPRDGAIIDPPYFSPGGDLLEWRKKVGRWLNLLKTAHDSGNDRSFHTMFKILVQTLYTRGLPLEQQSIVDEAQSKGIIDYMQTVDPVKATLDVVNVVTVDSPIATVTRLVFRSIESQAAVGPKVKTFPFLCLASVDALLHTWSMPVFSLRPKLVKFSPLHCSTMPVLRRVR